MSKEHRLIADCPEYGNLAAGYTAEDVERLIAEVEYSLSQVREMFEKDYGKGVAAKLVLDLEDSPIIYGRLIRALEPFENREKFSI